MPILHLQVTGEYKTLDGQTVAMPPKDALHQKGATVQVTVGPAQSLVDQWNQQGIAVPALVAGEALIDTGAANTCIDDVVAQQLGLPVVDVTTMVSASHTTQQNIYPIHLGVLGYLQFDVPRAMGANLAASGIVALIGRDILSMCTLHYNGAVGSFTLAI